MFIQMSDDVQIVSVTKTERPKSSRRKRKRSAVYTDGIDVVAIENLPEVTLVELPTDQESYIHIDSDDDYVTVTSSSKQKKVSKPNLCCQILHLCAHYTYMYNIQSVNLIHMYYTCTCTCRSIKSKKNLSQQRRIWKREKQRSRNRNLIQRCLCTGVVAISVVRTRGVTI